MNVVEETDRSKVYDIFMCTQKVMILQLNEHGTQNTSAGAYNAISLPIGLWGTKHKPFMTYFCVGVLKSHERFQYCQKSSEISEI